MFLDKTINKYIVATIKDWHINIFKQRQNTDFKNWILIDSPSQLNEQFLHAINPKYIFFPHWSWIVPDEIVNNFECVCFHSSDVPYGRGGSPIQNLIIRGYKETKISALRMIKELDAGPVYLKKPLSLEGKAQDIYEKSAIIISGMMKWIADNEPIPVEQKGEMVVFKRRQSKDNILPLEGDLDFLYNHIRMLDVESYPKSFVEHGNFTIDFFDAVLKNDKIEARVEIRKNNEKN